MAERTLYDTDSRSVSSLSPEFSKWLGAQDFTPQYGVGERLMHGAAMAFPRAIESGASAAGNLLSLLGAGPEPDEGTRFLPEETSLPAGTTAGQTAADLASALMPVGIELAMAGGAARAVGGTAGLTPGGLGQRVLSDATAFGALGLAESPVVGAQQAAEGAGYGMTTALSRGARVIPAALLAMGSKYFFDKQNPNPVIGDFSRGDISAVAGFLTAFLPGQIPIRRLAAAANAVPTPSGEMLALPEAGVRSGQRLDPRSIPSEPNVPGDVIYGSPPAQTAGAGAEPFIEGSFSKVTGEFPQLPIGRADNPFVQLTDMQATQSPQQILNRIPARTEPIPLEGRITPPTAPPAALPGMHTLEQQIFDPANEARLRSAIPVPMEPPDLQALQLAMLTREARGATRGEMLAFSKWAANLPDTPTPQGPLFLEDMWEQTIKQGSRQVEANPLLGASEAKFTEGNSPLRPEPPLSASIVPEGGTTNVAKGKLSKKPSWIESEGGFQVPDLMLALGRANAGMLVGGAAGAMVDDPDSNSGLVTGIVGGALLAMFGPAILRSALKNEAKKTIPSPGNQPLNTVKNSTTAGTPKNTLGNLIAEAQYRVSAGSESLVDRTLSRLDEGLGLSLGPVFKRILSQAAGPAQYHTSNIDTAFHKIALIEADDTMKSLTNQYLNGKIDKNSFLQQMGNDAKGKAYADFAIVARENADGLIDVAARGQGNSKRSQMMRDSMGTYLTKSYRIFVEGKHRPSEESINKLADKIFTTSEWGEGTSRSQIQDGLRQWISDVKENKGVYTPTKGKRIDQTVFSSRKVLNDEWKQFLGEITDPVDRIRLTTLKLKTMAEASNFMDKVVSGANKSDEGLDFTFSSHGELEAARQKILQQLQSTPSDPLLKRQILELQQYKYMAPDARYGALQGRFVHRNVHDVMHDWDNVGADSAIVRSYIGINQFMKSNVTYRNPMAIVRQFLSAPFFLQIGRGYGQVGEAMRAIRDPSHPAYREMLENGITNVDSITKDVLRDVDRLSEGQSKVYSQDGAKAFLGRIDGTLGGLGARGKLLDSKMADLFKYPDNVVRAATYLSAKARFAEELGLGLDSQDVINKAIEFTNRYTMNYNLLPKAIVKGRNVPFVNMFISYTAEMGRIMKNLGEDVIAGKGADRLNAVMSLGTFLAVPATLQQMSEGSLSETDRKDWEKMKDAMPTWAKDRHYFVTGRDPKTKKFRVYDFSNLLPADQFQQVIRAVSEGRPLDALSNNPVAGFDNNPAMNIASAWVTGKDRFSGRDLRGGTDHIANVAKEVLGPLTPGVGSQWRAAEMAFSTNDKGEMGITDKRGKSLSPSDFWLPWATAIKAQNLDLDTMQKGAISDYKSGVANEMAYFNDVAKSNFPKEVKEKSAARAKEAIRQLQVKLARTLGVDADLSSSSPTAMP